MTAPAEGILPSASGDALERLAAVFQPEDPGLEVELVRAGADWAGAWDAEGPAHTSVWGRLPGAGPGGPAGVRAALRREAAVRRVVRSARSAGRIVACHRAQPPRTGRGARRHARSRIAEGAVVEVHRTVARRAIDAVAEAAGVSTGGAGLRIGSGGSALVRDPGRGRLVRAGAAGTMADPRVGARVIEDLARAHVRCLPEQAGSGAVRSLGWTAEALLPGARPWDLTPAVALEVAAWCSTLPRAGEVGSVDRDVTTIASFAPEILTDLQTAGAVVAAAFDGVGAIARHGDLWLGNLLVEGHHLVGVVDWDAATLHGPPGVDLLHLWATWLRMRTRRHLGELLADRPWASDGFGALTRDYWAVLAVTPTADFLDALGTAWWLEQVAGDLRREPTLAQDERWFDLNVLRAARWLNA